LQYDGASPGAVLPVQLMPSLIWISFLTLMVVLIAIDLGLMQRSTHVLTLKSAMHRSLIWFAIALSFNVYVYFLYENNWLDWGVQSILDLDGKEAATLFLTGYLIEYSLSVDNVFVFAIIFEFTRIPLQYQHRVLFWGILGAIVMRGIMIALGVILINSFSWMTYVFGSILIISAARMLALRSESSAADIGPIHLVEKLLPVTATLHGARFFIRENGKLLATPLFVTLVIVEWTDLIFALDSIPAIFAVTTDPFLIFTSNVFAILGLRNLYFLVAGLMGKFRYLKITLVFILMFVGIKMLLQHHVEIPNLVSLAVIIGSLTVGILASVFAGWFAGKKTE
jgi:tellurite resistance protein TerC